METIEKKHAVKFTLQREKTDFKQVQISSSRDAYRFARQFYFDDIDIYESFFIIPLNAGNKTIGWAKISQGGLTSCIVDPRIVFKYAIEALAASVVLVHNHPSGNLNPSDQDRKLTRQIKEGAKFLDIQVLDHLILNDTDYYSLADNGLL